jgi:SpoVK/Ycf46/Vps4 family AAA+-type ATPase
MSSNDDSIDDLREAVKISPDNVPLRQHLADALFGLGRFDEAIEEYQAALALAPGRDKLKLSLATAFFQSGKYTQSLVVIEDLLKSKEPPAKAYLLHARLLLNDGNKPQAAKQYRAALDMDGSLIDPVLAERLGALAEPEVVDGRVRASLEGFDPESTDYSDYVERSKITFADIGGMEQVKEQVRMKIIYPMQHPETFKAYGKKIGGGILMYGPPGCGKTHLARGTAGEINAAFMAVGINDVLDMWIGNSERNLHQLFEQARRSKPCVLFFDEVDALAASRSDMRHSGGRHVINQFLMELDGIDGGNDGVLVLAATNAPWHLDSAFRRPGRFDRIVFVPPPDAEARAEILRILLKGKPLDNVDYQHLSRKTEKYSGADLKSMVDTAVEAKIDESMKKGGPPKPLGTKDLEAATKQVKPSTAEWFATARNYALYANEGGTYDDVLKYMKN